MSDSPDYREPTGERPPQGSGAAHRGDPGVFEERLAEARLAYTREMAALEDVDDKAMRSVRTSVLVVGFVSSAVGVAGPEAVAALSVGVVLWLAVGVLALLAATLRGIEVYTGTAYPAGPASGDEIPGEMPYPATARTLIEQYDTMTRAVSNEVDANAAALDRVHLLLRVGTVSLSVAAGAFVLSQAYGVDGNVAAAGLGLALLVYAGPGRVPFRGRAAG